MKANLFGPGTALLLLVTVGLASTAKVRLQAHGHQHGDVYGRIMHKPTASSGSSFLVTAIQGKHLLTAICLVKIH